MRYLEIILGIALLCWCCSADNVKKQQTSEKITFDKLLNKIDISHPHFGKKVYGSPKIDTFRLKNSSLLLSYQAKYGGDGEHSENLLKLFKIQGDSGIKLLDINIDSVNFVMDSNQLKAICGKEIVSLCDVCDGWEVAPIEDVFLIPIRIDIGVFKVKVDLTGKDRQDFLSRFEQQAQKNIAEQTSYGNENYSKFIEGINAKVKALFNSQ